MRLLYFSIIGLSLLMAFSCKKEKELDRFDPEEMLEKEQDSVKNLLSLSRVLIEKGKYDEAKKNLTIIINNFGSYQEVIEANQLLINLNLKLLVKQISNTKSIDSINIWIKNVSDPDIRQLADSRIADILSNSEDFAQLEDYLDSDGYKAHQDLANQRLKELTQENKERAYQDALAANDSKKWKEFLEDYPNHPEKEKIEEKIILLEVNEIFAGEYGEIPLAQLVGDKNFKESNIEITNDTRYTLTLRYTGPEIRKIDISPGATVLLKFMSGEYRVTASVNAAGVRNFAGSESLYGEYSSTYYISSN
ncbi:MAG: hypothetical protein KDC90_00700 [Ignavibacteriae bacterium]|nr:hypothetical protein [Ignavibacteriota bacterium]